VDEDEAVQHEAERTAAALHHVGWETGSGASVWAQTVRDALALHESARERFVANDADREAWERLHGSALMVAVAVDQVLAFERRVRRLSGGRRRARRSTRALRCRQSRCGDAPGSRRAPARAGLEHQAPRESARRLRWRAALARLARLSLAAKTGTETQVRRWRFLPSDEVDTPRVTSVNDESSFAS
jgi:hypothetical protein